MQQLTTLGTLGFSKNRNATTTKNMRNAFCADPDGG